MKKVSRRVEGAVVLACAALVALVFATGVLGKQKTWGYMEYLNLDFKQRTPLLSISEGAEYGIQNTGPGLNLARGTYRFKYWVDTDGTGELLFKAGNSAAIEPSSIVLGPGQTASETIELKLLDDVSDLQILVRFDTGTYMNVFEVRLYGQNYADNAFTLAFLLTGACLLFLLWQHGVLTPQGCGRLVLIGVAVLVVSAPVLKENYSAGHDYNYHMARIANLADGLRSGQFPVRAGGFTYNGYGAITSAFYPDLFLYPFALMLLAGASIEYVMSVLTIAASVLAAATMYACAKRIYGDEWAATCASVLYVGAAYRVANMMVRCAVGEMMAMGFLPLFVLGLWEVIFGDKRRWRMLAFGAFAVFMCHMISTLLCATLALGLGTVCLPRILREKRMGAILKAIGATALLSLFFLIPLVMYSMDGISADVINTYELAGTAMAPAQLFLQGAGDLAADPKDRTLSGYPVELGLPLIIGSALLICVFVTAEKRREKPLCFAMLFLAIGWIAALMMTTMFPWQYITLVTDLYDRIQFAWRFAGPACMMLSLAGGYGYAQFQPGQGKQAAAAALMLSLVMIMPTVNAHARNNRYVEFGEGAEPYIPYSEYNLPGSDVMETTDHSVHAQGGVTFEHVVKDGTRITMDVSAQQEGTIALPLFGFDGYAAELGGERLETGLGENNRLTVTIPEGSSGTLRVRFAGKAIWRVGDAISALTALALLVSAARGHEAKKSRKKEA